MHFCLLVCYLTTQGSAPSSALLVQGTCCQLALAGRRQSGSPGETPICCRPFCSETVPALGSPAQHAAPRVPPRLAVRRAPQHGLPGTCRPASRQRAGRRPASHGSTFHFSQRAHQVFSCTESWRGQPHNRDRHQLPVQFTGRAPGHRGEVQQAPTRSPQGQHGLGKTCSSTAASTDHS